jgi:hypothetical protein
VRIRVAFATDDHNECWSRAGVGPVERVKAFLSVSESDPDERATIARLRDL